MIRFQLPPKFTLFSQDSYEQVIIRIERFKAAIQNNQSAELILSTEDINSLNQAYYNQFSELSAKKRAKVALVYYEIQDEQIFVGQRMYPFWMLPGLSLTVIRSIKYRTDLEAHFEISRVVSIAGMSISENMIYPMKRKKLDENPGLLTTVLGSQKLRTMVLLLIKIPDDFLQIIDDAEKDKRLLKETINRISNVGVKDSTLILKFIV